MSEKKLGVRRLEMFDGSRRGKPKVRQLNKAVKERMMLDQSLFDAVMRDAEVRRSLLASPWANDPLSVYQDLDQYADWTEIDPTRLPEWEKLGEYLKLLLITQASVELGGYSFTVNVRPDLQAKWEAEGTDPLDRLRRLVREAMKHSRLIDLPFFYVIESATKSGSSRTKIHLHGVFLTTDPLDSTRFVVGMQHKIAIDPSGAGPSPGRRPAKAIHVTPTYDKNAMAPQGKGRWASYVVKNIMKWDKRIVGRRIFISREATRTATEFWKLMRNEG